MPDNIEKTVVYNGLKVIRDKNRHIMTAGNDSLPSFHTYLTPALAGVPSSQCYCNFNVYTSKI